MVHPIAKSTVKDEVTSEKAQCRLLNGKNNKTSLDWSFHFYKNALLPAFKIAPDIGHGRARNYLCPVAVSTLPVIMTDRINSVDTVFPLINTPGAYLNSKL